MNSDKITSHDELSGRLTPKGSDGGGDNAEEDTGVREGKLVDIE